MYYNELEKEEINGKIDSFFRYFGIDSSTLTQKEKLKKLIDQKISLEVDMDLAYNYASNATDKEMINKYLSRVESDGLAVDEIDQCINFLKSEIHENRFNFFKKGRK